MKKCSRCGIEKDKSMFQIRRASKDGLTAACKKCLSEYDEKRANNENRVKARKEYAKTEQGIYSSNKAKRKYINTNKKVRGVHITVSNALRDGIIIKNDCCEQCGSTNKIEGHHCDYDKPLDIMWLCVKCHNEWHKKHGHGANRS